MLIFRDTQTNTHCLGGGGGAGISKNVTHTFCHSRGRGSQLTFKMFRNTNVEQRITVIQRTGKHVIEDEEKRVSGDSSFNLFYGISSLLPSILASKIHDGAHH